jgi:predicted deacetylase
MNKFEFDNFTGTHSKPSRKNAWLIAVCLLWTSTNLAHLPWYLNRARASVVQARSNAAQATLATNSAFAAAAADKQEIVDAHFNAEWATAYNDFGMTGSTPVK